MFYTKSFVGRAAISDSESSALAWVDLGNLPTLLPNMARSLEAYRRFKTSGEFQMI
jgi:hypothetical protein